MTERCRMKKNYDKALKRKVALEAIKEEKTLTELSSKYSVPIHRISIWKKEALDCLAHAFESTSKRIEKNEDEISRDDLLIEIGQLKVENEFLKKKYKQLLE